MGSHRIRRDRDVARESGSLVDRAARPASAAGADARAILALQATAGNRSVARAFAGGPGSPHPVVQRFTRVPLAKQKPGRWAGLGANLRVSDDGKMAAEDGQLFAGGKQLFLEAGVLADAKARLAAISSPLTIEPGAKALQGAVPGKPKMAVTLTEAIPGVSARQGGVQGSGTAMTTLENCSAHGLDVMGTQGAAAANEAHIDVGGGRSVRNLGGMSSESDIVAKNDILAQIARRERKLAPDAPIGREEAHEIYNALSEKKRSAYAKEFDINQFARPQVGEGIEALRAGKSTAKKDARSATGFPMHFAPVVARSGDDYVALENFAKNAAERAPGDTIKASQAWYYRMYGVETSKEDQSYYGQHAEEASIGARSGLVSLTNRPVQKFVDND